MYERRHDTTQVTTAGTNVVNLVLFNANATKDTFNGGITYNAGEGSFTVNRKMRIQVSATVPWTHTIVQSSPYVITLLVSAYSSASAFDPSTQIGDQSMGVPTNMVPGTLLRASTYCILDLNSGNKFAVYFERQSSFSDGVTLSNNARARIVISEMPM
jgi:hypothetical protein